MTKNKFAANGRLAAQVLSLCCAAALVACGGGGGSESAAPATLSPSAPSTPTTPLAATLSKDNYLDALALVSMAGMRLDALNTIIGNAYGAVLASQDQAGSYPCPRGGSMSFSKPSADARRFVATDCKLEGLTIHGGTLTAVGASAQRVNGVYYLAGGDFTADQLRFSINDGFSGDQSFNGQFKLKRNSNLSMSGSGQGSVLRNGRSDSYQSLNVVTGQPNAQNEVMVDSLEFKLDTPRFPVQLTISGNNASRLIAAPDGAQMLVKSSAAGGSTTFTVELRRSAGGELLVSQVLTASDNSWRDALARAVK